MLQRFFKTNFIGPPCICASKKPRQIIACTDRFALLIGPTRRPI